MAKLNENYSVIIYKTLYTGKVSVFFFKFDHLITFTVSLTVEVQRANKSNPAQDRDPIFERGSTTTYSSFRKGTHSKPWSTEGEGSV